MAPTTRKSHAAKVPASEDGHTSLEIPLPDDLDVARLSSLLSLPNPAVLDAAAIVALYRHVLSNNDTLQLTLAELEQSNEVLARKDAEIEQTLQDAESAQADAETRSSALSAELEALRTQNAQLSQVTAALETQISKVASSQQLYTQESHTFKTQLEEREREKRSLTEMLDKTLASETRLQSQSRTRSVACSS